MFRQAKALKQLLTEIVYLKMLTTFVLFSQRQCTSASSLRCPTLKETYFGRLESTFRCTNNVVFLLQSLWITLCETLWISYAWTCGQKLPTIQTRSNPQAVHRDFPIRIMQLTHLSPYPQAIIIILIRSIYINIKRSTQGSKHCFDSAMRP